MIEVKNLYVKYQSHIILRDISFEIQKGDYLAIVGPNGSGKTTLIKTILGLKEAYSGQIIYTNNISHINRNVGYLPQKMNIAGLVFPATVKEIISTGLLPQKSFPKRFNKEDDALINQALELLQIEDIKQKPINHLSGGQQQRVLLARALVNNPPLLILDEPTTALDPNSRDCFYSTLEYMNKNHNTTIIVVSHDTHTISHYAKSLLLIDRQVIYSGSFDNFDATSLDHFFGGDLHECCGARKKQ